MPSARQREFERKVRAIIEKVERLERTSIRAALRLLERTRRDVVAEIAQGGPEYNLVVLRQVERAIAERIEDFRRVLQRQVRGNIEGAFQLGTDLVDEPLKIVTRPLFGVSRQLAQVAAEFSADLIRGLSDSLREQINGVLRRGVLGGVPVSDLINGVGKSLKRGRFRSAAARAETIVRTEILRVQAIAAHARMLEQREAVERAGYTLKKEWLSARDARVRPAHVAANGQVRAVDEAFEVGGESLMYPRDPAGSGKNVINCRCVSRPVIEGLTT